MDLAYADEGPGPVVVLLHGFPLSQGDVGASSSPGSARLTG